MLGLTPDGFGSQDHLLRRIKPLADSELRRLSPLSGVQQVRALGSVKGRS